MRTKKAKTANRVITISLRIHEDELNAIQKKANLHERGNLSGWFRRSASVYTPKR